MRKNEKKRVVLGHLGGILGVGVDGTNESQRKETGAMNRDATGAIVSRRAGIFEVCDCGHKLDRLLSGA